MAGEREQREALHELQRQFRARVEALDLDSPGYVQAFQQMSDDWRTISEKIAVAYPLDVPNVECYHAMLKGIAFEIKRGNRHHLAASPQRETVLISSVLGRKQRRFGPSRTTTIPCFWSK